MSTETTTPDEPTGTDRVLADLRAERARQVEKGYDTAHDDDHGPAALAAWAGDYVVRAWDNKGAQLRTRLMQAAALLVAAVESIDRQDGTR